MPNPKLETIDVSIAFPPGMLAELGFEADKRGLELNQLIVLWLEFELLHERTTEPKPQEIEG